LAGVKFEAGLKNNGIGGWCIDLTDTLEPVTVRCENLEVFSEKVSEMGAEYGNDIEVVWSAAEDSNPVHMQELRVEMLAYQEKYKDEIDKELKTREDNSTPESGFEDFNPNN
jgi:hypothetical protein